MTAFVRSWPLFKCPHCLADDVGEMDPYRCGICGEDRRATAGGFLRKSRRHLRRLASRSPWEVAVAIGWVKDESKASP